MSDRTKDKKQWLIDNNVIVYRGFFEYKGLQFETKKTGSKFYCNDLTNNIQHPAFLTKTTAIYWACKSTNNV